MTGWEESDENEMDDLLLKAADLADPRFTVEIVMMTLIRSQLKHHVCLNLSHLLQQKGHNLR